MTLTPGQLGDLAWLIVLCAFLCVGFGVLLGHLVVPGIVHRLRARKRPEPLRHEPEVQHQARTSRAGRLQ